MGTALTSTCLRSSVPPDELILRLLSISRVLGESLDLWTSSAPGEVMAGNIGLSWGCSLWGSLKRRYEQKISVTCIRRTTENKKSGETKGFSEPPLQWERQDINQLQSSHYIDYGIHLTKNLGFLVRNQVSTITKDTHINSNRKQYQEKTEDINLLNEILFKIKRTIALLPFNKFCSLNVCFYYPPNKNTFL